MHCIVSPTASPTRELRLPDAAWFAGIVARYLPVWVLFSGMNIFSARALGATLDADLVVTLIYATCVSWIAGFVIIGLPGGLGVREAVFISMMTAPLGAGLAVSVAVISRVVSVAVDLLGAAISVPVSRTATGDRPRRGRDPHQLRCALMSSPVNTAKPIKLIIQIPCFNEEKTLPLTVADLPARFRVSTSSNGS